MGRLRPIPLVLLIHSVTYEEKTNDSWGDGFANPVTLSNVLVQPASSIQRSSTATEILYNSVLFFDATNSTPLVPFKKGSKIHFDGKEMFVEKVNTLYAFESQPHHYEIGLN